MKTYMVAILAIVALLVIWGLIRRSRKVESKIDLDDLVLGDDGKLSKAATVMLGAFGLTTWLMVYLALNGKMTEGYLAIYVGAWIAPTVTKLFKGTPPATVEETSTTSTTKTVTPTVPETK